MLIAGTSCVDYSNLNNEKQDMHAGGESGRTFFGMLSWVTTHRPPIVVLENVKGAPWKGVVEEFERIGYSATSLYLDTKQYYIPHTRQRGYLMAVNKKMHQAPEQWARMVKERARPASSALDAFFLPADDPRVQQARASYAKDVKPTDRRGRIDWARCEARHQRARLEEELGLKRPLTHWEDS
jgi:site-specific DNA-cytosine methylase